MVILFKLGRIEAPIFWVGELDNIIPVDFSIYLNSSYFLSYSASDIKSGNPL